MSMKKEIFNQLQKAYIAIKSAYYINELTDKMNELTNRINPNPKLRNQLITIEEILEELLGYK